MADEIGFALSSETLPWCYRGGRSLPVSKMCDYEDGGIGIQDPSAGLEYQVWRTRVTTDGTRILLGAANHPEQVIHTGTNITEVSLSFDGNMRPHFAWVEEGVAYFNWYNSLTSAFEIMTLPGAISPKVAMDDKRAIANSYQSVLLAYIRDGVLYGRGQRDRFQVEYTIGPVPYPGSYLVKMGLNNKFRFQYTFYKPLELDT